MKVQILAAISATLFLLNCPAASAKVVEGWDVFPGEKHCAMYSEFSGGTSVGFSWYPAKQETRVTLINENWDSLRSRHGEKVRLDLKVFGDNVEYDEWWSDNAIIIALEDESESITAHWGEEYALEFATAIALGEGLQIKADGRTVGQFSLDGTYAAMLELRRCGAQVLQSIDDPFAG